jgi:hypothetical protein
MNERVLFMKKQIKSVQYVRELILQVKYKGWLVLALVELMTFCTLLMPTLTATTGCRT